MRYLFSFLLTIFIFTSTFAQEPTQIGQGGTWQTARGIINTNMTQLYDSLVSHNSKLYGKAPINNAVFTGTTTIATLRLGSTTVTSNGTELNILDGVLANKDEINKLVGLGTDTISTKAYARSIVGNGNGSVTSVALSTPTGLTVSGSPITGNGTLQVSLTSGYTIPTIAAFNAKMDTTLFNTRYQSNYDTAFAAADLTYTVADSNKYGEAITRTYFETQLTDSLTVLRSQINSLITTMNGAGLLVTSINVLGTGGATTIETNEGTLQMLANVEPNTAVDTTITWSAIDGTGDGNIDASGLLTAVEDGTVTARATANDGSGVYGERVITISNNNPIAQYQALLDEWDTDPDASTQAIHETFVTSLVNEGLWDKLAFLFVRASHDSLALYTDWIHPGTRDSYMGVTGYTWDQNVGVTGAGGEIYSGFNPTLDSTKYNNNSASVGVYIRTNLEEGTTYNILGASDGTNRVQISFIATAQTQWRINSGTSTYENSATVAPGFFVISRTANATVGLYKNGSLVESVTDASGAMPNAEFGTFGVGSGKSHQQVSIEFASLGLSAGEISTFNTICETFADALGFGIQP